MKKVTIFISFLFLLFCFTGGVHANVSQGRALLFNSGEPTTPGLLAAKAVFEAALQANPNDQEANFFLALIRLPALVDNAASYTPGIPIENVKELLDSFGVADAGRDLFNWTADFNLDSDGKIQIPPGSPTGSDVQDFIGLVILTEIEQAFNNIAAIDDTFTTLLTASETGQDHDVEVDYGDVLLYESFLQAFKTTLLIISSYDLAFDMYNVLMKVTEGFSSVNGDLLDIYPNLLRLLEEGKNNMQGAKSVFMQAVDSYVAASEFIRSEVDDQSNDLIHLDAGEIANEAHFRTWLAEAKTSLIEERTGTYANLEGTRIDHIDLNRLFGTDTIDPIEIRDILPVFDGQGHIFAGTFPDTTMGGILVDVADESLLLDFLSGEVPLIFTFFESTMVMDGSESDWQAILPILPAFFPTNAWNTHIEYIKVARDENYTYWMIKLLDTMDTLTDFSVMFFTPPEIGWQSLEASLSNQDYQFTVSPPYTQFPGTTADFGIGEIIEGRIPLSISEGLLGLNMSAANWDLGIFSQLYAPALLNTVSIPVVTTGPDRVVFDSVTLSGKLTYPALPITSWEWTFH
ncbi:hypothetical protein ACFL9U_13300, partial [Thermodesulfobacteriota bacterium]